MHSTSQLRILDVLTIVFIVLKLTDNIDWSWWLVLSPTLVPIGLLIVLLVLVQIIQS